jgi:hypothetical protein
MNINKLNLMKFSLNKLLKGGNRKITKNFEKPVKEIEFGPIKVIDYIFKLETSKQLIECLGNLSKFPFDIRSYIYNKLETNDIVILMMTSKSMYVDLKRWFQVYCEPKLNNLFEKDYTICLDICICQQCRYNGKTFPFLSKESKYEIHPSSTFKSSVNKFFNLVQPYQHHDRINEKYYGPIILPDMTKPPSGHVNFSNIDEYFCVICVCKFFFRFKE